MALENVVRMEKYRARFPKLYAGFGEHRDITLLSFSMDTIKGLTSVASAIYFLAQAPFRDELRVIPQYKGDAISKIPSLVGQWSEEHPERGFALITVQKIDPMTTYKVGALMKGDQILALWEARDGNYVHSFRAIQPEESNTALIDRLMKREYLSRSRNGMKLNELVTHAALSPLEIGDQLREVKNQFTYAGMSLYPLPSSCNGKGMFRERE